MSKQVQRIPRIVMKRKKKGGKKLFVIINSHAISRISSAITGKSR